MNPLQEYKHALLEYIQAERNVTQARAKYQAALDKFNQALLEQGQTEDKDK